MCALTQGRRQSNACPLLWKQGTILRIDRYDGHQLASRPLGDDPQTEALIKTQEPSVPLYLVSLGCSSKPPIWTSWSDPLPLLSRGDVCHVIALKASHSFTNALVIYSLSGGTELSTDRRQRGLEP